MNSEDSMNRRQMIKVAGASLAALVVGCQAPEKIFTCERDRWYAERRADFFQSTGASDDECEQKMKRVIANAADKLTSAIHPSYFDFPDVGRKSGDFTDRNEKKDLGIVDIYIRDQRGISIFSDYFTSMLEGGCMSNARFGENFNLVTRYKLTTLLSEYDMRKGIQDFDPRDAIKRGLFKGADAVLTGNIYTSQSKTAQTKDGTRELYRGGAKMVLQMIDVVSARVVGWATESLGRDPLLEDWIGRNIQKRFGSG